MPSYKFVAHIRHLLSHRQDLAALESLLSDATEMLHYTRQASHGIMDLQSRLYRVKAIDDCPQPDSVLPIQKESPSGDIQDTHIYLSIRL